MKEKIPQSAKNLYHYLIAFFSALLFRFPATHLIIVGVTGTDGKTTTVNLIYHILDQAGLKAGMISTVEAKFAGRQFNTGFHVTTPRSFSIQKLLRKMVDSNIKYAVLEITSHALDQNRCAFVPLHVGLITNVTQEHLDYHKSYNKYLLTKSKILKKVKYRVLNSEDASFGILEMKGSGQLVTFGGMGADYFGETVSSEGFTSNYAIHYKTKQKQLKTMVVQSSLIGDFNLSNILASFAVCKILGLEDKKIVAAIESFRGVQGRMEQIDKGQDFKVIIDFAHTPRSIELSLSALKKDTKGRLICVFGAAGERDRSKRSLMGQVAANLADLIVLTNEDPRSEKPEKIIGEIAKGVEKNGGVQNKTYWRIVDRSEAISKVIGNLAESGDTVVILGKGHEKSMNIGGVEYPWDDVKEANSALKERLGENG